MRNQLLFAAALSLGLCASGVASAQSFGQPPPYQLPGTQQYQQARDALMGQAQNSVDSANANIDALNNKASTQSGAAQKQTEDVAKSLTDKRDSVKNDMTEMSNSSAGDWAGLQQKMTQDLSSLNGALKDAASITHLSVPGM
jgi:hypothetical protein